MKKEWILIANASMARLFSRESDHDPLVPLNTFEHVESRLKSSQLGDDRVGHGSSDTRPGGVSFEPRMSPQRKQHLQFAHTLAQRLDEGLNNGECKQVTLYASSPFLGELKGQLSPAAKKALRSAVDIDLTSFGLRELEERIAHELQAHHPQP
ncbi:MAG: host attachment protein [Burkholderiales bacterium]|nr:host attachment protein [Burkholderiales bacterium]